MAKVVNLNKFRKAAKRKKRTEIAAKNRVQHGRTAAERKRAKAELARANRSLDGARIVGDEAGESEPSVDASPPSTEAE